MAKVDCVEFWQKFHQILKQQKASFDFYENKNNYGGSHWGKVNDSTSSFTKNPFIGVDLVERERFIRVNVYIPNNKTFFDKMLAHKTDKENTFGSTLTWRECKNAWRIEKCIYGLSYKNKANYENLMIEMIDIIERFIIVFGNDLAKSPILMV